MGSIPPHEPIDRFDEIWRGWQDLTPVEVRLAQHVEGRARFLAALERHLMRVRPFRVLEVGCGSAIDLAILAKRVPGVQPIGLDISAQGLRVAKTFLGYFGGPFGLCRGDTFSLPFADESFGMVFSQGLLEHFRDPSSALREQVRVLAGGGILVINVPQRLTGYTLHKRHAIRRGTWPWGWETEYTAGELVVMGRRHGLKSLEFFGGQYWIAWGEPTWILRDLYGKIHRRNPLACYSPFPQIERLYNRLWTWLEEHYGHLFLQNVVGVFQKPSS